MGIKTSICGTLAFVLVLTCHIHGQSIKPADIDTVRANIIRYLTGEGANRADSIVAASLKGLESSARHYIRTLTDSGWPDIDYNLPLFYVYGWSALSHYGRLRIIALAYRTAGQSFYLSDSGKTAFEKATRFIESKVYADMVDSAALRAAYPAVSNWWHPYQGVPLYYGPALLLMQGHMDTALFNHARATLSWCINYWRVWELEAKGMYEPSGDRITQALNELCFGVLTRDTVRFRIAYRKADTTLAVIPSYDDGIKADFMLHHHRVRSAQSNLLHTGSYGGQVAEDGPKYFHYARNTGISPSAGAGDVVARYMADGIAWCIYKKHWDMSVIGRSVTRAGVNAVAGLNGMIDMAAVPGPKQAELQAGVKALLKTWNGALSVPSAVLASGIVRSVAQPAGPSGHRHFFRSDYTVHRRPGYFMSVKMHSTRIRPAEYVNNEGKQSWHLSDGLTYIVRNGDEYFSQNVFPTLDWNRLPGTTVQRKNYTIGSFPLAGKKTFVGGVQYGPYGASVMDFAADSAVVTAKKSYFYFENEMVCLGADIDCPSMDTAETIIDQRRLSSASIPTTVNGLVVSADTGWKQVLGKCKWIHNDSMGYFFPDSAKVNAMRVTQKGRWSEIGTGDTILRTNPIFTLLFNHGVNAANKTYAYAVLPNKTASDMAAYSSNPAVSVIANNDTLQAVENSLLKARGAVFWKRGRCGMVSVDTACIAFWQWRGDTLAFSAAFPPHQSRTLVFTLDTALKIVSSNAGVTVTAQSRSTRLTIAASDGRTFGARLLAGGGVSSEENKGESGVLALTASPNPFNPLTNVFFCLPQKGCVNLSVYDLNGRFVRSLIQGEREAGRYFAGFNSRDNQGKDLGSGVYIIRLRTDKNDLTRKLLLKR